MLDTILPQVAPYNSASAHWDAFVHCISQSLDSISY
jgi:hypothetical protein